MQYLIDAIKMQDVMHSSVVTFDNATPVVFSFWALSSLRSALSSREGALVMRKINYLYKVNRNSL